MINFSALKIFQEDFYFIMAKKILLISLFVILLASAAQAAAVSGDKVLARVAGHDITESEALEFIKPFGQQAMMLYASEQGRKMVIDDLISMRLYALDAEEKKLDQTPEFIENLENIKRTMLAQAAMKEVIQDISVTEDEVKKFYDENQKLFTQPERVHASHILVSDDASLAKVQEELKAGKSFDVVAKEFSIDPGSAANGGDLGEFPRGVMVPEFEKAAFELKNPGDVSEPVKSQFGWHLIKLGEHVPESVMPIEQVKAHIEQELREKKTQDLLQARSKELEDKYKVERF